MANTSSISFPNMFDVTGNCVSVVEDSQSIVNRTRLLMLTEPTELYMNPDFGVGLKKYLFQYNNKSIPAIIKDRIIEQLKLHEPCVDASETQIADGLLFTEGHDSNNMNPAEFNKLKLTVSLSTVYGDTPSIDLDRADIYTGGNA